MSGPRFDEIEGEEATAPSFDAIEGEEESPSTAAPTAPVPIAPDGPVLRAPERSAWNKVRDVIEKVLPSGIIPDEGTARGAVASTLQGPTMNWADETAGLLNKRDALLRYMVDGGQKPNPEQQYREGRDAFRNAEGAFRKENPAIAFALTTASGALAPTPRGSASPDFITRYASALIPGAIAGGGAAEEARDIPEAASIAAPLNAGGVALGEAAGDAIGYGLGKVGQWAGSKVDAAESKAQQMAADKVAAELASAKGKLGATTQEANRAVENLMRLQQVGGMSQEQQAQLAQLRDSGVLSALHQKLADSMLEQVPGAAGRIDIARAAYEGLAERAPAATQDAAEEILSGGEAKHQIMDRVRRYLPTVAGSLYGAGAGAGVTMAMGGGPGEALVGGLAGAGIRPAVRAVQRMAAHPAVQRMTFAPIERGAAGAANVLQESFPELISSATRAQRNEAEAPVRRDTSTSDVVSGLVSSNPEALGPYAQQLQQAEADGTLPLVHYTLQQTDPNYRRMLDAVRSGGTQ